MPQGSGLRGVLRSFHLKNSWWRRLVEEMEADSDRGSRSPPGFLFWCWFRVQSSCPAEFRKWNAGSAGSYHQWAGRAPWHDYDHITDIIDDLPIWQLQDIESESMIVHHVVEVWHWTHTMHVWIHRCITLLIQMLQVAFNYAFLLWDQNHHWIPCCDCFYDLFWHTGHIQAPNRDDNWVFLKSKHIWLDC